ncbi:hypothetical protein P7K49_001993 [Saguinus oedipus]|uniref:Uncharacterized protein n=1 Tax=Saguinus oedipus TaxID=9490 RepID=A0ABQ9WK02_SAGOE|nr:hypothetical protein P7K49_001993 [Saguinus oedipus]
MSARSLAQPMLAGKGMQCCDVACVHPVYNFMLRCPFPGSGPTGSWEGRGGSVPAWAPAESSPPDEGEPGFQELQHSPLEPWGLDVSCAGLALKDEVDSLFPDFFAC